MDEQPQKTMLERVTLARLKLDIEEAVARADSEMTEAEIADVIRAVAEQLRGLQ